MIDVFDETKTGLKSIWDDPVLRQQAKIVLTTAIGEATELSVKDAQKILDELDRLLKDEDEEAKKKANPGL